MSSTIDYYNTHAKEFSDSTRDVEFTQIQDHFLSLLPPKAAILDFGCGSGRDTKYFLDKGYQVDAADGSTEICVKASEYTGIPVKQMLFQELDAVEQYDGIWACASILHVPKDELYLVMERMHQALKKNGIVYASFKYGIYEGFRNGRYFTDFTEESFSEFMSDLPFLIEEEWITEDVRPGRSNERWLNVILRKS